jgi:mono/diheme cytochrome c family protein
MVAMSLVACSGGDLAEDLTPIPTLPKGEEPELVEALRATPAPAVSAPAGGAGAESGAAPDVAQLVAQGKELFVQCEACHGAADGAGPALTGMGARAATRVAGLSAEAYLRQSIVQPSAYVVEGFPDIMPKNYGEQFSEAELQALVAYILTETGGAEAAPAEETGGEAEAEMAADPANGEKLFASNCGGCHGAADGAGPALTGMGERAASRVEGLSAEEYLHQSIVEPGAYVVEGFSNIMPATYGEKFSEQELNDIVAYILTQ